MLSDPWVELGVPGVNQKKMAGGVELERKLKKEKKKEFPPG